MPGRKPQSAFRTAGDGNPSSGANRHGGNGRGASLSDTANQVHALGYTHGKVETLRGIFAHC
ncbi:MAG: hypothetical protein MJZ91_07425 [Bacteroidales bacterium]|nr:hypothetical protein [Bacteroidales bacterium]